MRINIIKCLLFVEVIGHDIISKASKPRTAFIFFPPPATLLLKGKYPYLQEILCYLEV